MKINYSEKDNNSKINEFKMSKASKIIIMGAFGIVLTMGSGMTSVKAQYETEIPNPGKVSNVQIENSQGKEIFENGYNFYKTGDGIYVNNIEWNIENNIYFNKGIQAAIDQGEEMLEGLEAPDYQKDINYSAMSTPELMLNAKRLYDTGLEFADTGVLNSIGDPAVEELRKRGVEFDPLQAGVNHYEALGKKRHAPVIGNNQSLSEAEMEKWKQYGELFYTTGQMPSDEEWNYEDKNTGNIAGKNVLFNQGIQNAIDAGKQIFNANSVVNYDDISAMSTPELLSVLAVENWFEMGVEYQKTGILPDAVVNGSLVDDMLRARGINLSASDVFQAGCNNERLSQLKQIYYNENIKKEDVKELVEKVTLEEVISTNNDLQKLKSPIEINERS